MVLQKMVDRPDRCWRERSILGSWRGMFLVHRFFCYLIIFFFLAGNNTEAGIADAGGC